MVTNSLEYALFNVFTLIGTDYYQPSDEWIQDILRPGSRIRNPYFGQDKKPVKFDKGTRKELNIWLTQIKDKYPVVWLEYPAKRKRKNNGDFSIKRYPKTRLIFATNNTVDKTVNERIHTTKVVLESIVDRFLKIMRGSAITHKYIYIDKTTDCTDDFFPNWSSMKDQPASGAVDIWDVVILECDLILKPNCVEALPE